jgi:hypothetical protein
MSEQPDLIYKAITLTPVGTNAITGEDAPGAPYVIDTTMPSSIAPENVVWIGGVVETVEDGTRLAEQIADLMNAAFINGWNAALMGTAAQS